MNTECTFQIRPATPADVALISRLLRDNELPACGLEVQKSSLQFWVATKNEALIGVIGLSKSGTAGLLRSLAVAKNCRNNGIAQALLTQAIEAAAQAGTEELYLLTGTAKQYFIRNGFRVVSRASLPPFLLKDAGMENACSACNDCLQRSLTPFRQ